MAKKKKTAPRVAKGGVADEPDSVFFDDLLEGLGLYENSKPVSGMRGLYNESGTTRIGYWHMIEDIASDGLGGDTPPYWSALEIVLHGDYLFIEAFSEYYDDPAAPSDRFFSRRIHWKKGADTIVSTEAIWGEPSSWRRYKPDRVEKAKRDGVGYYPWFYFTFVEDEKAGPANSSDPK